MSTITAAFADAARQARVLMKSAAAAATAAGADGGEHRKPEPTGPLALGVAAAARRPPSASAFFAAADRIRRTEYAQIRCGARASSCPARARTRTASPGSSESSRRESRHEHASESDDFEDARDGAAETMRQPVSVDEFCASRQCARKEAFLIEARLKAPI